MNAESWLLIAVLRRAVAGSSEVLSLDVDWEYLLKLAGDHMLLPLLYDGLHMNPDDWKRVPDSAKKILNGAFLRAVCIDTRMDMVRSKLEHKLTQKNIPHIFLKGAVLKQDYPVPALRTMCDLDVLVRMEDFPQIAAISDVLGGVLGEVDGNHRNYSFPEGVTVEFHPNLLHQDASVGTGVNPGWQYADPDEPNRLTEEGRYLNTICHLASHFSDGGIGVRFVLDVWVSRHLRKAQPERSEIEKELEHLGLLEFTQKIEALAEMWFGDGVPTPLLEELGEYILSSGSHGVTERNMLNAVTLSPGGNSFSALLRKVFYSREEMEGRFPWCKGKPWLLPVAWCIRAYRAVTTRGDLIRQWHQGTAAVSKEDVDMQKEKLARFGIHGSKKGGIKGL